MIDAIGQLRDMRDDWVRLHPKMLGLTAGLEDAQKLEAKSWHSDPKVFMAQFRKARENTCSIQSAREKLRAELESEFDQGMGLLHVERFQTHTKS